MSELPRYIADLCGIIDSKTYLPAYGRPQPTAPLQMVQDKDGVWIVTYDNEEIGWITKISITNRDGNLYRAVSTHGAFKHCASLSLARSFIMAEYH
jgi:hypothetical protein